MLRLPLADSSCIKLIASQCKTTLRNDVLISILWRYAIRRRIKLASALQCGSKFHIIKEFLLKYLGRLYVLTGPRSTVGNVSSYRCVSDCRSRGHEFDPGPVLYFRGDWSWNNFYGHSPPFRWFIQEGMLSVTSESMWTNYSSGKPLVHACPGKRVVRWTGRPTMAIAAELGRNVCSKEVCAKLDTW